MCNNSKTDFSPGKLQRSIIDGVKVHIDELSKNIIGNKKEEYLTKNEVAELLRVSTKTVDNWCDEGILSKKTIKSRAYFKRSQIDSILA